MAIEDIQNQIENLLTKNTLQDSSNAELYASIERHNLSDAVDYFQKKEFNLIALFCVENFEDYDGFTLIYMFDKKGNNRPVALKLNLSDGHAESIAKSFPAASWYEREIADGFGVEFDNAFDNRRLLLHETYPDNFHPLRKSFINKPVKPVNQIKKEYVFREIKGEGIYQIPVGPVHAGVIEPGHFRFNLIGEPVISLEIRMFYKHRGIEKLAEGMKPEQCVKVAESISGDESAANAVCFCNAIERISGISVAKRDCYIRTILLEMERIYSLLSDLAGMVIDIAFPVGASPLFNLREEIFRRNESLTGSRFIKNFLTIGGIKKDIDNDQLVKLKQYLSGFKKEFAKAERHILSLPMVIDRFETTGYVRNEIIRNLNITGPIARASGTNIDTRIDRPYSGYTFVRPAVKVHEKGDVMGRFKTKAHEISDSVRIIEELVDSIPKRQANDERKICIKDGYALSMVESARGNNICWVYIKNGVIERYKARTASFCNWQAIEHAVPGNIVPDFPLINKSFNLSYAGTDL